MVIVDAKSVNVYFWYLFCCHIIILLLCGILVEVLEVIKIGLLDVSDWCLFIIQLYVYIVYSNVSCCDHLVFGFNQSWNKTDINLVLILSYISILIWKVWR